MASNQDLYGDLDRRSRNIRLLQFESSRSPFENQIICNFANHNVDNCPPFAALSYAWGNDGATNQIQLEGKPFLVRDNLMAALHELVHCKLQKNIKYFWIDAICINQEDNTERTHQVNMMKEIYSNASVVIAWLGPSFPDSDLAMRTLQEVGQLGNCDYSSDSLKGFLVDLGIQPKSLRSRLNQAMGRIVRSDYFNRLWVVQEFLLSRNLLIMCGPHVCTSEQLRYSTYWRNVSTRTLDRLLKARTERIEGGSKFSELPVLVKYFQGKCSDPRDRIYALLGLITVHDPRVGTLPADYDISTTELFYRTARFCRRAWPPMSFGTENPNVTPFTIDDYWYLGIALKVPMERIQIQEMMHVIVDAARCSASREVRHTKIITEGFERVFQWIGFDVDRSMDVNSIFREVVAAPKITGQGEDSAGWKYHEHDLKNALRIWKGESLRIRHRYEVHEYNEKVVRRDRCVSCYNSHWWRNRPRLARAYTASQEQDE